MSLLLNLNYCQCSLHFKIFYFPVLLLLFHPKYPIKTDKSCYWFDVWSSGLNQLFKFVDLRANLILIVVFSVVTPIGLTSDVIFTVFQDLMIDWHFITPILDWLSNQDSLSTYHLYHHRCSRTSNSCPFSPVSPSVRRQ